MQSYLPHQYSLEHASRHDFEGFAFQELNYRKALRYPPYCRLVRALVQSPKEDTARIKAEEIKLWLEKHLPPIPPASLLDAQDATEPPWEILGPAPCAHAKLENRFRWHLIVKFDNGSVPLELLRKAPQGAGALRVDWDVDPVSLL